MALKPYIVATETNITCVCMAKDETDAVNRCLSQYYDESSYPYPNGQIHWTAYDFKKYFSDRNKELLILKIIERQGDISDDRSAD